MPREGALDLPQTGTGPIAAARHSSSLSFTWGGANCQWLVGLFEVLSASQESLWAQCPQLHFQSKGDGVSHQGGCGGWGYQYWFY